jgi:5-methylcytosine-specific restriction endonuclease McrA
MSYLGLTRGIGTGQLSLAERIFGKKFSALDATEHKTLKRYSRKLSYYRNHAKSVHRQRTYKRDRKVELLEALGWDAQCMRCGYDTYIGALDFHHVDPTAKSGRVTEMPDAQMLAEAGKCELICANCHREKHADESHEGRPRAVDPVLESLIAEARRLGVMV